MDFLLKRIASLSATQTACLVVGVFESCTLSRPAQDLNRYDDICEALMSGDMSGKPGSTLLLRGVAGLAAQRVLLVGLGKDSEISEKSFGSALQATMAVLMALGAEDAVFALPFTQIKNRDARWYIGAVVSAAHTSVFRSDGQKSVTTSSPCAIRKIVMAIIPTPLNQQALTRSIAICRGIKLAKELGNLSANVCTPEYLARTAQSLGQDYGFEVEVLGREELAALRMGGFLAVAKGSVEPPKFIILKHNGGAPDAAPIVLVGKGVTFDSGGISIKGSANMDEMKYDMCGAAAVVGTFRAIGELDLKANVIGLIPACENMPSGSATKPGDIITAMNGLTIEVLNTDAEGRLILCDALTYAERYRPEAVIDIATLTGACVVALGNQNSGLFTRSDAVHDQLARELIDAGQQASDTAWRLPISEGYNDQLKSTFADLANIGTPGAGSITAACFLENFTRQYTWAHLDIAGTSRGSGAAKGATGRPVALLTNFLVNRQRAQPAGSRGHKMSYKSA